MTEKMIHKVIIVDHAWRYLCNQACGTTLEKSTQMDEFVTCKNCLRELNRGKSDE